jgi:hypothetical protein
MSTVQPNYLFLNSTSAGDVVVSEGVLRIGSGTNITPDMKIKNIKNVYQQAGAAATARIQTLTVASFTAAAGIDFAVQVTQFIGSEYKTVYASYETTATDTNATVAAKLAEVLTVLIQSGSSGLATAIAVSNVITLTASSSNPVFVAEVLEGGMTLATASPVGNEAVGLGSDLIADGITGISTQPVAATIYSLFLINYFNEANSLNAQERNVEAQTYVYYNSTSATAFEGKLADEVYAIGASATAAADAGNAVSVEKI